ncbi:hypothetical protein ES705_44719 [subsurface metagenome]
MAVKWFEDQEFFEIPSYHLSENSIIQQQLDLNPKKTQLEYRKLERIIPDVILTTRNDYVFAVEIIVTSDLDEDKRKLIDQFNLPTIRLDLSEFYNMNCERCKTDYVFVKENLDNLLTNIALKSWIIPVNPLQIGDKLIVAKNPKSDNTGCLIVMATLGIIYLIKKFNY